MDDHFASDMTSQAIFFLDALPLLDENWTGIPMVCAGMARALLSLGCDVQFCIRREVLPREAVLDALERNTGLFLERDFRSGMLETDTIRWPSERVAVGLSSSVKQLRRVFDVECSIIHDISTILQPQYHLPGNIAWHAETVMDDLASNDVTVCISQATMNDLVSYLGADRKKLVLAYNGVEWPWWFGIRSKGELAVGVEPYIIVLSTREPRKNLAVVLEMLCRYPEVLDTIRFVFVGKAGWLMEDTEAPEMLAGALEDGRIVSTGFVTEYEKYLLLRGAAASIFPSFYEGYGLPVVESLSVSTPCIASFSSAIPEVGGDLCTYFDPCSADSLKAALESTLTKGGTKGRPDFDAACKHWVEQFTWAKAAATVLEALEPAISAKLLDQKAGDLF